MANQVVLTYNDKAVDGTNPLPVTGPVTTGGLTDTQLRAADVKISLDGEAVAVNQGAGGSAAWSVALVPVACAAADVHAPASNTAAVVTYAAAVSLKHCITGIAWSYTGGIPAGGNLKVEDVSGTTVFSVDIDESGVGVITFPVPKKAAAVNTAMIITLAAGGTGITGKVSVLNHWTEV